MGIKAFGEGCGCIDGGVLGHETVCGMVHSLFLGEGVSFLHLHGWIGKGKGKGEEGFYRLMMWFWCFGVMGRGHGKWKGKGKINGVDVGIGVYE